MAKWVGAFLKLLVCGMRSAVGRVVSGRMTWFTACVIACGAFLHSGLDFVSFVFSFLQSVCSFAAPLRSYSMSDAMAELVAEGGRVERTKVRVCWGAWVKCVS